MLWFEDKLWLASDYMLRIWNGKELVPVTDDKGQELHYSGHMDAYDGLLVVADTSRVMAYQNDNHLIVSSFVERHVGEAGFYWQQRDQCATAALVKFSKLNSPNAIINAPSEMRCKLMPSRHIMKR